jgi:hypothetical protein
MVIREVQAMTVQDKDVYAQQRGTSNRLICTDGSWNPIVTLAAQNCEFCVPGRRGGSGRFMTC